MWIVVYYYIINNVTKEELSPTDFSTLYVGYIPHTDEVYSAQQQTGTQHWCTEKKTQDMLKFILEIKIRS